MPEEQLTTFEYALLGLVGMSPMTGYDIHKVFATTPLRHFSSSPGAIYPALRRLGQRGLLGARLDTTKEARPRRVYFLSDSGKKVLEAWLHQSVTREELIRGSGVPILRFALAEGRLSRDKVLAYLGTYQRVLAAYLEELYKHAKQMETQAGLHGRLSLEQGIRGFKSELEWTNWAATKIRLAGRSSGKRGGLLVKKKKIEEV